MAEMDLSKAIKAMQEEVSYTLGHLELPRLAAGVAGFDGSEEADKKFMEIQDEDPEQLLALQAIHRVIYEIESRVGKEDKEKEKPNIEDLLQILDELTEIKIDKKIGAETVSVKLTEKEEEFRKKYIEETKKRIHALWAMIDFIMGKEPISYEDEELEPEEIIARAREVLVDWVNEEYSVEFFIVRGEDTLKHNDEYMQAVEIMIEETGKINRK